MGHLGAAASICATLLTDRRMDRWMKGHMDGQRMLGYVMSKAKKRALGKLGFPVLKIT